LAVCLLVTVVGCRVGPSYVRPEAPTAARWLDSDAAGHEPAATRDWWKAFEDPALVRLVETAYGENLSLRAAGLRVVQAQARRAIAIGDLFPQQQELRASYTHEVQSENTSIGSVSSRSTNSWQAGFDAMWELDLWGKFRRGIEAADADLIAAVASYDDVLVSLVAEVAATYVRIRVLDERLAVASENVRVQGDSLGIARVRFEAGGTSERDLQEATALLKDTEAAILGLSIQHRQAVDSLCALLGKPPADLGTLLGGAGSVPKIPPAIAIGIPADLLRRRPDIRGIEQQAAAQSARIGVATAELFPSFQLIGSVGLSAEDASSFLQGRSFGGSIGPAIRWPVLNYGRLVNDVRLQDAKFQELIVLYGDTVLTAQREVEDALVGYVRGSEQIRRLEESGHAASRAVELSVIQYREGAVDYTSVLTTQQSKLREGDLLASTRGTVALSAIALYKALGGGWEMRVGNDFVPEATREEMRARSPWGGLLEPTARSRDLEQAEHDAAADRPWWSGWLRWPKW
jgi:NodT family efflux transporter outer membrane factor (OMF) lipoprotein